MQGDMWVVVESKVLENTWFCFESDTDREIKVVKELDGNGKPKLFFSHAISVREKLEIWKKIGRLDVKIQR